MTPKEKCDELIEKFLPNMYCYMGSGMLINAYDEWVATDNAKRCAVILCDEILTRSMVPRKDDYYNIENKFWQDVKQEIEKL